MQRRNYAALFAALVTGFGAIGADAQSPNVVSVTVTSPDSGDVLAIDGKFTVEVVVRDFRSEDNDGVDLALVTVGGDPVVNTLVPGEATGGASFSLPADGHAGTVNASITASVRRDVLDANDVSTPRGFQGEAGAADSVRITSVRGEMITYTWWGTIDERIVNPDAADGGLTEGIRAWARAVDPDDDDSAPLVSDASLTFGVDNDRPDAPTLLSLIDGAGFADSRDGIAGLGVVDTTRGYVTGITGGTASDFVAAIGDTLKFDIDIADQILKLVDPPRHKLALGISNGRVGPDVAADADAGVTAETGFANHLYLEEVSLAGRDLTQDIEFRYVIKPGDFGNLVGQGAVPATRSVATAYIIDPAGNASLDLAGESTGADDVGETEQKSLTFFLDGTNPVLSSVADGDTLLPASGGTISDGTRRGTGSDVPDDDNPIVFNFGEGLRLLEIVITEGDSTTTLSLANSTPSTGLTPEVDLYSNVHGHLAAGASNISVEFAGGIEAEVNTSLMFHSDDSNVGSTEGTASGHTLSSGTKTITFRGTDFAGNTGETKRENVTLDLDSLTVTGLFPSDADELTTIEHRGTADVRFTLDEEADTLVIRYARQSGNDRSEEKRYILSPGELLAAVGDEGVYEASRFLNPARTDTGLVHGTAYRLSLLGRDVAGNWDRIVAGTFDYDTTHVVPQATVFSLTSTPVGGEDAKIAAGAAVELLVEAFADADKKVRALTYGKELDYNNDAVVKVSSLGDGAGLTLEGKGLVPEGTGRARLSSTTWGAGRAKVTLKSTKAPEQHAASVHDSSDADSPFGAQLEKDLFIEEAGEKQLLISVPETVTVGQSVQVELTVADEFGNTITDAVGYVAVSTSVLGVETPLNALPINGGKGSFEVRSNEHLGPLTLNIRAVDTGGDVDTDGDGDPDEAKDPVAYRGSVTVTVVEPVIPDDDGEVDAVDDDGGPVDPRPDGPDRLVGEDYKGALGEGDQGGFVMLTFDLSDDHSTIDGYRIWRDITVTQDADEDGNLVELSEPTIQPVPWGRVDAIPGVDVMRVVVATLDGDATFYGVTSESHGFASDATRTGAGDDGMADDGAEDDGMADDGAEDDGMADDGAEDDGMADDGAEDDGAEDDGAEDDGAEDDGAEDDGAEDDGAEDDGAEDDGSEDDGGEETGTATDNKRAFAVTQSVSVPYELMAETMVRSREAAQGNLEGPVFATLTPEALAFHERGGLVPSRKSVQNELTDHITRTEEAVRAIDDIAPAPVTWVRALDTPADAGASITIDWTRSIDDRIMTSMVPQAIGQQGNVFTSAGVVGYNISRRIGEGAWQALGDAPAGSSSYEDLTAANGVRYSYKVEPKDLEQITASEIERSAMAIRNTVVDGDGNRIVGLFGADSRVDYDDFFIFADHFGLTAESDLYEAAFDIIPNDVIDVDDFFAFAESFGKEVAGIGKAVPTKAGLNSEARFYIDNAAAELPRVGEEMALLVSLEDFAEVRGYGFTVNFDNRYLEFVEPRFENNPLGEAGLAQPRVIANADGEIHIAAFGETVSEGDLGVTLVFRSIEEIEESLVEVMAGGVQDGSYGLNRMTDPVAIRVETRPEVYALENNFPNPFNPETTIKYQLPDANEVTLEVFNMLGQVVRTMVDREFQNAGRYTYQWDATNDSGQPLSSGIYFYRVTAGGEFQSHKKMLLLK